MTGDPASLPRCASCDRPVAVGDAVCPVCGEPRTDPERKLVTLLFADLTGYTELCSRLDPEEVHHVVRPAMTELRQLVEAYGGSVPQVHGDGFMAVFGAPVAHEDDAERAVRAALDLVERVDAINARRSGLRLPALHVGVNTGEVLVAGSREPSGFSVAGDPVNLAARLCGLAAGGRILVGERTAELSRGAVDYGRRRLRRVRGLTALVPVYEPLAPRRVRRPGGAPSHGTPFHGRADVLALLDDLFGTTVDTAVAHAVVVTGEAGIGKSRLAAEFAARAAAPGRGALVLTGACRDYGEQLPLSALAECVADAAGLALPATDAEVTSALSALVDRAGLGDRALPVVRRLGQLLGVDRDTRRGGVEETLADVAAVRVLLEGLARADPVVLVLEDLHWADAGLRYALSGLVAEPWAAPVLLLGLARPDVELPDLVPTVALAGLEADDLLAIVTGITGGRAPAWLAGELLGRAGGNPLFLETCVRMLVERGGLQVDVDGRLLADDTQLRLVPHTMRMHIAARLDALPVEEKALLQDAAVGGDLVWDGLLRRLAPADDVDALLDRLVERELLVRRTATSMPGSREHAFKHALIRDVAYESLPRRARSTRHRATADWMREVHLAAERRPPLGLLAHHYRQAWLLARSAVGEPPGCDVARLAVGHLLDWGEDTRRRHARTAERAYDDAVEIVGEAPRCFGTDVRARLHAGRAATRNEVGRFDGALEDAAAVEELLGPEGDVRLRAQAALERSHALSDLNRMAEATDACALALDLFAAGGDKAGQAEALYQAARNLRHDDVTRMTDGLREAYHACREAGARDRQAEVSRDLAYVTTLEGGTEFTRWYAEAQRLSDDPADLRGRASLRRTAAFRAWYAGDHERALTLARDAAADASDAGSRWVEADALLCEQAVLAAVGRLEECERRMQAALDLGARLSGRRLVGMAYARGAVAALRRRSAGDAAGRLGAARERLAPLRSALDLATVDAIEAEVRLDAGDWAAVGDLVRPLVGLCEARGWTLYALPARLAAARALLGIGSPDAVALLAGIAEAARRADAPRWAALAAACLDQARLVTGVPAPAPAPRRAGGDAGVGGDLVETRAVARENDGLRAWGAGDLRGARVAFGEAAGEWARLGATAWLARALAWQAAAARRTDEPAEELDTTSRSLLSDLGAQPGLLLDLGN